MYHQSSVPQISQGKATHVTSTQTKKERSSQSGSSPARYRSPGFFHEERFRPDGWHHIHRITQYILHCICLFSFAFLYLAAVCALSGLCSIPLHGCNTMCLTNLMWADGVILDLDLYQLCCYEHSPTCFCWKHGCVSVQNKMYPSEVVWFQCCAWEIRPRHCPQDRFIHPPDPVTSNTTLWCVCFLAYFPAIAHFPDLHWICLEWCLPQRMTVNSLLTLCLFAAILKCSSSQSV